LNGGSPSRTRPDEAQSAMWSMINIRQPVVCRSWATSAADGSSQEW
jgi:hypothetical protein